MNVANKVHCPACRGRLQVAGDRLACAGCAATVPVIDGIIDFVGGRASTTIDPAEHEALCGAEDATVDRRLAALQLHADGRWPTTLGSVLEVGCGTGLFSRAMLAQGLVQDAVLTDASFAMLGACRTRLRPLDIAPVTFATYSGRENAFRDAVFDTCLGASVLHHVLDVRGFLAGLFRTLKPGGRAFFLEPNLRFHRALMQTLADLLAQLQVRSPEFSLDRQKLHNVLAEARRVMLHQDDTAFLATLEDKHLFEAEALERMGLEIGFATAEALPTGPQPTGVACLSALCTQLEVGEALRREVLELLPAYATRYMNLLAPRDRSPTLLLWMEKQAGPQLRRFSAPAASEEAPYLQEVPPDLGGGLPPHWSMGLQARPTRTGIGLSLTGWCLVNADVRWVRVTLDGVAQQAPVWRPRPDVQQAMNGAGLYPAWNAFCSGLDADLAFDGVTPRGEGLELVVEIVLASGAVHRVHAPDRLPIGEEVRIPA